MKLTKYLMKVNVAMFKCNRLEGKFVSKNVMNFSRRNLSSAELFLLFKGRKFVPSANKTDQAKLKRELEVYRRKLSLMSHLMKGRFPRKDLNLNPLLILETKILLLKHI